MHEMRFERYRTRARRQRTYTDDGALHSLWTAAELAEDARRQCAFKAEVKQTTTETVHLHYRHDKMVFEREQGQVAWTISPKDAHPDFVPATATPPATLEFSLCADGVHTVARTAKLHSKFRSDLLASMLEAERVLCNMVLFHCTTCNTRFPTFHPKHKPQIDLQCLATCPVDVDTWEDPSEDNLPDHALMAPYCRGRCARCAKELATEKQTGEAETLGLHLAVFRREPARPTRGLSWPSWRLACLGPS